MKLENNQGIYIPLLTALLIFLGYFNYYSYYSFFDIDITSFLTTGELILSFLPLGTYWFIVFVLVISIYLFIGYFPESKWKSEYFKAKAIKRYWTAVILGNYFFATILLMINIFSKTERYPIFQIEFNIHTLTTFLIAIGIIINVKIKHDNFYTSKFIFFYVLFLLVMNIGIINHIRAIKVINLPSLSISFKSNNANITTDTNLVFIGKTSEFIFLRELKKKTNKIYKVDNIDNIEIFKIE